MAKRQGREKGKKVVLVSIVISKEYCKKGKFFLMILLLFIFGFNDMFLFLLLSTGDMD